MTISMPARLAKLQIGRLFRDYIVLSGGQMFSKLLGFIAFAYLARILTVAQFGAVETVVGMSAIGYKVIELGTGSIAVRRIAQGSEKIQSIISAVISARLMIAIAIVPLLAVTYAGFTAGALPVQLVWLFALSLFASPFAHDWLFQAHEKMGYAAFAPLLKMLIFLGAIFLLAPAQNGVVMVGVAEILAMTALALFFSVSARLNLHAARPAYGVKPAIRLLKDSAPLGVSAFVNSVGLYAPVLVVAIAAGAEAAGLFGAAHRVVASVITFSYVYYFNLLPLFSRLLHRDPAALQRLLNASMRITAWAGVTASLGLWALGDPIMTIIFSESFSSAGLAFKTLVWMAIFEVVSGNARWLLVAAHRQASVLAAQIIGAAAAILLTFALAPGMGAYGAAIAVVIANGAIWAFAWLRTDGLAVRPPLTPVVRHLVAGCFAVAVILIWGPPPIIAAFVAGAVMLASAAFDPKFIPAIKSLADAKSATHA